MKASGLVTAWRGELLALRAGFAAPPALAVERGVLPLLGGKGYGAAVLGYSVAPPLPVKASP